MTAITDDVGPVLSAGTWASNGELIVDVAKLGYLNGRVLDVTYGLGRFWNIWQPFDFVACDINPKRSPIGYSVDFRRLPFEDASFDAVVCDPPYKLNGSASGKMDDDYGVDVPASWRDRHALIKEGMTECYRVLRRRSVTTTVVGTGTGGHLLVKCQDQVCGGKVRFQTREFSSHGESLGLRLVDEFLLPSYRPQPPGRTQQHSRRNYSNLLIFRRER